MLSSSARLTLDRKISDEEAGRTQLLKERWKICVKCYLRKLEGFDCKENLCRCEFHIVAAEIHKEYGLDIVAAEIHKEHGLDIVAAEIHKEYGLDIVAAEIHKEYGLDIVAAEIHKEYGLDIVAAEIHKEYGLDIVAAEIHKEYGLDIVGVKIIITTRKECFSFQFISEVIDNLKKNLFKIHVSESYIRLFRAYLMTLPSTQLIVQ